jgi:hypothetical protein
MQPDLGSLARSRITNQTEGEQQTNDSRQQTVDKR